VSTLSNGTMGMLVAFLAVAGVLAMRRKTA
jgi:hypothetical protein